MMKTLEGDSKSYNKLLLSMKKFALACLKKRGISSADSDDIIQETLISVDKSKCFFDTDQKVRPWFSTILSRRTIDFFRVRGKKKLFTYEEIDYFGKSVGVGVGDGINKNLIEYGYRLMNSHHKNAFYLSNCENLSISEIAAKIYPSPAPNFDPIFLSRPVW